MINLFFFLKATPEIIANAGIFIVGWLVGCFLATNKPTIGPPRNWKQFKENVRNFFRFEDEPSSPP